MGDGAKTPCALLALAWALSTVALRIAGPVGSGFVLASALTVVATAMLLARPSNRPSALATVRALAPSAVLVVLAYALPAAAAGLPSAGVVATLRLTAVVSFGVAVAAACGAARATATRAFAYAGAAFLAVHLALYLAALVAPALHARLFLTAPHEQLGTLPRFSALTGIPASTGTWALLAMGLAEGLPGRRARRFTRAAGLAVACATLSIATLAAPFVLAVATLRGARRLVVAGALAFAAVAALQVHVLSIDADGHHVTLGELPAGYDDRGLGAATTPVREVDGAGVRVRGHLTLYGALATRAVSCFAEHPLVGVGPARFKDVCPSPTMNTYGLWRTDRSAHNQLLGFAAEAGLLGLALLAFAFRTLTRSFSWSPPSSWAVASAFGALLCACGGDVLFTMPTFGFLAVSLLPRCGVERRASS